jgi:hypothetical protein
MKFGSSLGDFASSKTILRAGHLGASGAPANSMWTQCNAGLRIDSAGSRYRPWFNMARPEGIEPPTLCLEGLGFENLNALSTVAYGRKSFRNLSSVGLHGLRFFYPALKLPRTQNPPHRGTCIEHERRPNNSGPEFRSDTELSSDFLKAPDGLKG